MELLVDNIGEYLQKHNIKPSYPRIKVMEYLIRMQDHPTVDRIYNELAKEMPTLSKTTVYNTLNLFIDSNVARLVAIEDNETRYDADTSDHGHFKCLECGKIYDFDIKVDAVEEGLSQFRIKEKNLYYKGICPICIHK